jgi:hypothetical protein
MALTPEQLKNVLTEVLRDEMPSQLQPLKDDLADVKGALGELAAKVDSYLGQEWNAHLHDTHPRLIARVDAIEKKLGITAA